MIRRGIQDITNQTAAAKENKSLNGNNGGPLKKPVLSKSTADDSAARRSERLSERRGSSTIVPLSPAQPLDEFDREVSKDIRYVTEYSKTIHDSYLQDESKYLPNPNYMSIQSDVTPRMRAILIDWLVEVHQKFKMMPQTLYICINVLDRYLERKVVTRDELQLIGCAALWTASKIEEIYSPEVQDFVLISDRAFRRTDLIAMEGHLLNELDFKLTFPTHWVFLTRWARVANADKKQRLLAEYCVERTLQEHSFLRYKPSLIASAAMLVAMEAVPTSDFQRDHAWTPVLEKHSSYTEGDLQECVQEMREIVADAEHRSLSAVRKKYLTDDKCAVARINVRRQD